MRVALAFLLVLHGIAHLPGLVASWNLTALEAMPYHTTLLGDRIDIGDAGMRVMGGLWLATSLAFVITAYGTLTQREWWVTAGIASAAVSLSLCVLEYPAARVGVGINVAVLVLLATGFSAGWLKLQPAG